MYRNLQTVEAGLARVAPGACVEVYWGGEGRWYCGTVAATCARRGAFVDYDDGDAQWERLAAVPFRVVRDAPDDGARASAGAPRGPLARELVEERLYGVGRRALPRLDSDTWTGVLMGVAGLEIANVHTGGRWPMRWGLEECLAALRHHHTLVPPPGPPDGDDFEDDCGAGAECDAGAGGDLVAPVSEPAAAGAGTCAAKPAVTRAAGAVARAARPAAGRAPRPGPRKRSDEFEDSLYLATHTVYCLCNYTTSCRVDAPWLFAYLRRGLAHLLRLARSRRAGVEGDAEDGLTFVDLDALSEAVDCLRGLRRDATAEVDGCETAVQVASSRGQLPRAPRRTGGGDPDWDVDDATASMVHEATAWLLEMQREDGSWPAIWHPAHRRWCSDRWELAYCELHPTWVTVYALCDRPVHQRRDAAGAWLQHVQPMLRRTGFSVSGAVAARAVACGAAAAAEL